MTERSERGREVFSDDIGVPADEAERLMRDRVGEAYADEAIWAAGGPGWNDAALTDRDRSLLVIAALIGEGILGERLDAHLDRAVRAGLDEHAIEVANLLLALYIGQARTSVAAEQIRHFFRDRAAQDRG